MLPKQYEWYNDPRVLYVHVAPMPFRGAPGEAFDNELSHTLSSGTLGDDPCCVHCDARPWMHSYSWPCGYDVPLVTQIELHSGQIIYDVEYAPGKSVSDLHEDFISFSLENKWCFDQKHKDKEEIHEKVPNR